MSSYSSDLDRALDGLGFSYIDGVPFRIDPRIESVANYDYTKVDELLQRPIPNAGLSDMCTNLVEKIGVLEKQVLEQLKTLEAEKEAKKEQERKDEEELENKRKLVKRQQEELLEKAAALSIENKDATENVTDDNDTEQDTDLELVENGDTESPADTETEPSTASISDFNPQPPKVYHQVLPTSNENSSNILPTSTDPDNQNLSNNPVVTKPLNINFSEFEAESDPFEKAELQTIDDLQELAAILTTTATSTFPTSSAASVYSTPSVMNTSVGAAGVQGVTGGPGAQTGAPRYPYYPLPPQQQSPFFYQQQNQPQIPTYFPYPPVGAGVAQSQMTQLTQDSMQQYSETNAQVASSSEMKSSKSVGDIMVEIKKEAEALEKMKNKGHQRKNSRTPPPRAQPNYSGNTNSGKNVLDDWIPWPDIGQKSSASVSENPSISPILSDLSPPSQAVCRQISEMGFDLSRVAKGCKSLGDDRQKLINYCLMVDKILGDRANKFSPNEVEYVIPIHNLDEETSKKHLGAFHRLEELGFDRVAIHAALIDTKLDHDKALEKLLK